MQAFDYPVQFAVNPKHRYNERENEVAQKRARTEEGSTLTQRFHARVRQFLIEKARELAIDADYPRLLQRYSDSPYERALCLQSIPNWLSQYSLEMQLVVNCVIDISLRSGMVPQHEASVAAISQLAKQQLLLHGDQIRAVSREISIYQNYEQSRIIT